MSSDRLSVEPPVSRGSVSSCCEKRSNFGLKLQLLYTNDMSKVYLRYKTHVSHVTGRILQVELIYSFHYNNIMTVRHISFPTSCLKICTI